MKLCAPLACVLLWSPLALIAAGPAPEIFVEAKPAAAIYHEGWIDFNKNGVKDPYEDPALEREQRVADLVARMTSDEKTAQMVTLYGFPRVLKDELPTEQWATAFWKDGIGNIDEQMNGNTGWTNNLAQPKYDLPYALHARVLNDIQRFFVERTRLGIPADMSNEGIRGLLHSKATSFPAQLGVASAFDRELVREIGRVTGREARALGYTNVYSPILEVARDQRWGRIIESYGEDPFLVSELGVEQVRGIQEQKVVSTLKHYAVYSVPQGGRDGEARTNPQVTWRDVQTIYLAPFRRAVRDGGALGVMSSYNDYDGVPVSASRQFLTDILRDEFGFKGYVVSDSGAVEFVFRKHRVATSPADAVRQVVAAGVNIRTDFTMPEVYGKLLRENVASGALPMAVIDERVREILRVKFWLGLFDHPYVANPAAAEKIVRAPASLALAARAARESIVLLKNEGGALPLKPAALKTILVAGPLANDPHAWWSRYAPQHLDFITPLAGLKAKLGAGVEVRYAQGVAVKDERFPESDVLKEPPSDQVRAGIAEAVAAAKDVDVIIAALGESDELCRESGGRTSLELPGYQEELLEALAATGKPLVLVLSSGRPLSVNWAAKHVPAIVEMWLAPEQGGAALADILLGDVNPSGRLPVTFPKSVGQIPINFPVHPGAQSRDPGMVTGPLFPFGFGLSYTKFIYANLKISPARLSVAGLAVAGPGSATPAPTIQVTCDVTNAGARAGDEVVQLYLRDDYSSVTTFERELRGFVRVSLAPGETKPVAFTLTREHLQLYDRHDQWTVEPGGFTVMIGASSEDIRLQGKFVITRPDGTAPEEVPVKDVRVDPL
jgi:beta-glucosidase